MRPVDTRLPRQALQQLAFPHRLQWGEMPFKFVHLRFFPIRRLLHVLHRQMIADETAQQCGDYAPQPGPITSVKLEEAEVDKYRTRYGHIAV